MLDIPVQFVGILVRKALPHPNFRLVPSLRNVRARSKKMTPAQGLARVGDERFFGWSLGVGLQQTR
jgi:hypothetical protein